MPGECAKLTPVAIKQTSQKNSGVFPFDPVNQNFGNRIGNSATDQVDGGRRRLARQVSLVDALTDRQPTHNRKEPVFLSITRKPFLRSTTELSLTSRAAMNPLESAGADRLMETAGMLEQLTVAMAYLDIGTLNRTEHAARAMVELAAGSAYRVCLNGTAEKLEIDGVTDGDGPPPVRNSATRPTATTGFQGGTISFGPAPVAQSAVNAPIVSPPQSAPNSSHTSRPPIEPLPTPAEAAPTFHTSTSASEFAATLPASHTIHPPLHSSGILPGPARPSASHHQMFSMGMWHAAMPSAAALTSPRWPEQSVNESSAQNYEAETTHALSSPTEVLRKTLQAMDKERAKKAVTSSAKEEEPVHVHVDSDLIELYSTTPERESNRNRYTG